MKQIIYNKGDVLPDGNIATEHGDIGRFISKDEVIFDVQWHYITGSLDGRVGIRNNYLPLIPGGIVFPISQIDEVIKVLSWIKKDIRKIRNIAVKKHGKNWHI